MMAVLQTFKLSDIAFKKYKLFHTLHSTMLLSKDVTLFESSFIKFLFYFWHLSLLHSFFNPMFTVIYYMIIC